MSGSGWFGKEEKGEDAMRGKWGRASRFNKTNPNGGINPLNEVVTVIVHDSS